MRAGVAGLLTLRLWGMRFLQPTPTPPLFFSLCNRKTTSLKKKKKIVSIPTCQADHVYENVRRPFRTRKKRHQCSALCSASGPFSSRTECHQPPALAALVPAASSTPLHHARTSAHAQTLASRAAVSGVARARRRPRRSAQRVLLTSQIRLHS